MVAAAAEPHVLLLPGSLLPADLAYGALTAAIAERADAAAKDLEVYATDEPPPGYSLDTEIDGVLREADRRGWTRFPLLGYSARREVALDVVARDPQRLLI